MACYPLILLMVGLNPQDLPHTLSDTIEDLIKDCNNNRNLGIHSALPAPPLFPLETLNYPDNYYEKPFNELVKDVNPFKYEITPLESNDSNYKESAKDPEDISKDQAENIEKNAVPNTTKRIVLIGDAKNVRNRERSRSILIPTIDNAMRLIRSFKNKSPIVAISDRLLKKLTEFKDEWIKKNPHIIDLHQDGSPKQKFLGIATKYLAKLIAEKVRKIKKVGSKILDPFGVVRKFRKVIEAAINYLGSEDFRENIDLDEGDDVDGGIERSVQPVQENVNK